jgi:hypothetical protein
MILVVTTNGIFVVDMSLYSLLFAFQQIAVFCLSLMEENWPGGREAKRCLAKNGLLFIAETTRSLSGRLYKLRKILEEEGFQKYADEEKGDFTFLEARIL